MHITEFTVLSVQFAGIKCIHIASPELDLAKLKLCARKQELPVLSLQPLASSLVLFFIDLTILGAS